MQKKAQFDDRIRNLLALAEDNSVESRTLLFSHICDLFLQNRSMESEKQIRMLVEIINELINDVDISIRIELCSILLNMDHPPEELIKLISEDIIEVSGKLLEQAIISEEQLLYLIKYASDDHRDFINRRFGLSPLLRRELEEIRKNQEKAAPKVSLNQLEEERQASSELNEDTTANILEVLKASKNRQEAGKNEFSLIHPVAEENILPQPPKYTQEHIQEHSEQIEPEEIDLPFSLTAKVTPVRSEPQSETTFEKSHHKQDEKIAQTQFKPKTNFAHMADKWFWEVDREGNLTYLSDNSKNVFSTSPEKMIGADFLSLWVKESENINDNHDFITLFEKRSPFRDEHFLLSIANNNMNGYLLSAIATFDVETGRFTGLRGSAQMENVEEHNPVMLNSNKNVFTKPPHGNDHILETKTVDEELVHKPAFSDNITPYSNENMENQDHKIKGDDLSLTVPEKEAPENQDDIASELLHNLSHEFRTPLNAIIGFSQMIDNQMWGPVSDHYRRNTKDIMDAANHLKEAVNNILDGARIEAGLIVPSPGSFSLKSIIQEAMIAIRPILESKEIKVSGIDDNIDVILYNDKHCIILCLVKMITFAIKQASIGSDFHLSVLVNSNAQVRIEIPLINMNINEQDGEKIFQKITRPSTFSDDRQVENNQYNTKISSGFGLAVAQDTAHLIGGKISTLSDNGKITHIVLTISTYPIQG